MQGISIFFFAAICLPGLLLVLRAKPVSLLSAVFGYGLLALVFALFLRIVFGGVIADDTGVTVRNPVRSYRIKWDEIESFRVAPAHGSAHVPWVRLRDGRTIRIWGLNSWAHSLDPESTEQVLRWVRELNEELARCQATPASA